MNELIKIHKKVVNSIKVDTCFVCYGQMINGRCTTCGFEKPYTYR